MENVLPVLASKVVSSGKRLLINARQKDFAEHVNTLLWTYVPDSWIPHGTVRDGHETTQPVFICEDGQNPNGAQVLMLVDEADVSELAGFERCLFIFDGNAPDVVARARVFWKNVAATDGYEAHYWAQNDSGKWEEKARSGQPSPSAAAETGDH